MAVNKWAFFWGLVLYLAASVYLFLISGGGFGFTIYIIFFFIPGCVIVLLGILSINNINIGLTILCIAYILSILVFYRNILLLSLLVFIGIVGFLIFTTRSFYKDINKDKKQRNIRPNISFILIWVLILFQIVSVLFLPTPCSGFGENAQVKGNYFTYEKLLGYNGPEYCGTGVVGDNPNWLSFRGIDITEIAFPGYILLLLFIVIRAYYLAFKNRNKDELNNKIPLIRILTGTISLIIIISLILYSLFVMSNTESNTDQTLKAEPIDLYWGFEYGEYNTMVTQEDGKILIGGNFTSYLGQEANRIIRLNTDGSIDTSFNIGIGFDNVVQTIVIQDEGKILVGGRFSTYQGSVANRIIRLNSDGSIDTSFNVGNGFDHKYAYITTMAIQKDGKIIVAGNFGEYKGVSANRILRFNADGSRDKTFISKVSFNTTIHNITLQSDYKLLVAGGFGGTINYKGIKDRGVIRLNTDGTVDTSFNAKVEVVKDIVEQSDGKIILVGDFDRYKGAPANGIIRINPDGSIDTSFNPQIQSEYDAKTVAMQPDGKILVGGDSKDFIDNRITTKGVIRLNPDGSKDETFSKGLIKSPWDGFEENIRIIAIQSDGKLIVVGDFYNYQGSVEKDIPKGVARLNSDGTWDNTFLIMRDSPPALYTRP